MKLNTMAQTADGSPVNIRIKSSNFFWIFSLSIFFLGLLWLSKALLLGGYPDFTGYYFAPRYAVLGLNPYLGGKEFFTPYVYPPFIIFFFYPLSLLPYEVAARLWVGFSIICLLLSLFILLRLTIKQVFQPLIFLVIGIFLLTYFPSKFTLGMGQINLFILLLISLFLYATEKKKESIAGICLGLAVLLKVFPLLFILYGIFRLRWRMLIWFCLTLLIAHILTLLLVHSDVITYFYSHVISSLAGGWKGDYYNQSLSGFLTRHIGDIILRRYLYIGSSLLFIISSLIFAINSKIRETSTTLLYSFLLTTNIIVNSFSWQHHFVWIIPSLVAVFGVIAKRRLGYRYYLLLGICIILISYNVVSPHMVPLLAQSHVFFGALLLWGITARLLTKIY